MKLEEKVIQIVVESLHRSEAEVTLEASFVNDLGADSLDTAELMMAIEDSFKDQLGDQQISEEEAQKFETVGDVVKFLRDKGVPDEQ